MDRKTRLLLTLTFVNRIKAIGPAIIGVFRGVYEAVRRSLFHRMLVRRDFSC